MESGRKNPLLNELYGSQPKKALQLTLTQLCTPGNTLWREGLFLLEVVVSAAPLLGLLGTVTGLVKVFSQIPAGGGVGDTHAVFSEGIAMALLTTIAGLAIAIPTLISHSYLVRLIDKRTTSISWLTERLVDAIYHKVETNYREIS